MNDWTTMAARAYSMYSGTNEALQMTRGKNAAAKNRADEVRQEMIMMTLIRLFAAMGRQYLVSLQSANRLLKGPTALSEVAIWCSDGQKPSGGALAT
ncbi:hypothetical protein QEZ47_00045 [Aminobacter anthyllidis]|uniref:hypothetical protein n=1 Tax=Aminobacter anthyllidis TaxID=1035067 RepID=UPI0024568CAC|nr:hypothetical protein [Aminobacter anthyllidis]MDH4983972.1 hypothetical protein [Aminobacter anthyllidis]